MSEEKIVFDEDREYRRIKRTVPVPQKGLEGWLFNKLPGKYIYKKALLIGSVFLLFLIAFIFFILGLQNIGETPDDDFLNRVENTRSR